ncbi:MAG: TonB-dependent receptor [Muribaculaceae bacterium]|nr:TonB-dependent receptor [Muribaculaceae bacterium]
MKIRIITSLLTAALGFSAGVAQNHEQTDSLARELQEVVVTANQPSVKLVGSTIVSTISGSPLAELGNALDVLAQLPMIKVEDSAVSVIGKNNVEIYIDGHPMRDDQELQQLLSSNLRKVELDMAPGAEYQSTVGAVLRITTKRNIVKGLSITDQLQLQRRRKWSVMDNLGLSYHSGKWELFVNGTVNHNNSIAKGFTTNSLIYDGKPTVVGASQHNAYPTTVGVIKAGFNFNSGNRSVGAYYRYNPEKGDFTNTGVEWLDDNPAIARVIDKRIRGCSHLASLYYENRFADNYQLHFDGDFRSSSSHGGVATTYPESSQPDVCSDDKKESTLWAGKLYMKFPLFTGDFTVGTQDSYTHTSLDYTMLTSPIVDYIPSSLSDSRQTSASVFASWKRTFGMFSLSAGARYEYINYDFRINGKRDEDVSRRDHTLTPDISLSYSFNNQAQINLSYKMATVKPPYSQLTGALNYVGMHEIEGGNPALHDERMHDLHLSAIWKGFMLQSDLVRSLDTYAYVKELYPADDLQLLMHPVNINVTALSMYLIWSKPVKCWTPDVTAGVYRQWLRLGSNSYDKPIFSYYFDNTFSLPHNWLITANISGRTEGDMHTNRFGSTLFTMDASIGKTFLDRSLTLRLAATDIFNTSNNDWTMNTNGIFVDKHQSYDRRGISLRIIYNFQPRKSAYKGASASESEMNRL